MRTVYTVILFVVGLFMGSFYNVVGYRLPNKMSLIKPNSHCTNCKKELKWYHLIPVFSYLFLGGKCAYCKAKIGIIHPLVELITGVLFAVSYYSFGFTWNFGIALVVSSLFAIIIVSDLNYLVISDEVLAVAGSLIIVFNFFNLGIMGVLKTILYGLIMFGIMFLMMKLGNKIFKQESLGGGDIKLMLVLGMTLPLIMNIFSIFIASCIALPISLIILFKNKDNVIPFGPFLVAGNLLVMFLKLDVLELVKMF